MDDPFTSRMDVFTSREIHHGISTPECSPGHFVHFLLDGGGDSRVANVGINLDQEVAPDDHRLTFGMIDVGWDNGASSGDLVTNKLRLQSFTNGNKFHLRRDNATSGIVHLGDSMARFGP